MNLICPHAGHGKCGGCFHNTPHPIGRTKCGDEQAEDFHCARYDGLLVGKCISIQEYEIEVKSPSINLWEM